MDEKKTGRSDRLLEERDALRLSFSRRLALVLEDAQLDPVGLAAKTGEAISPQAIRQWRAGKGLPSLEAVSVVADALGVPAGWLAFGGRRV